MNISISNDSVAYLNGNVYTVDNTQPWAEAFIVTPDAKFAAVGTTASIRQQAQTANLITVDLNGSFIMPGIHDSHVHTFHSGLHLLSDINMDYSTNTSNLASRMQSGFGACAFHNTYSDWIVGVLDSLEAYDRALLDADWPNNPVLIHGGGGHTKYLNTLGLERAGFNLTSEPDSGSSIFGRRQDGSLTGAISGQHAMGRVTMAVPRPTLTHVKRALQRATRELHRHGVTSVQEAAAGRLFLEAVTSLDREAKLQMEYATHILYRNEWLTGEIRNNGAEIVDLAREFSGAKRVDTRFVKVMMDGSPTSLVRTTAELDDKGEIEQDKILEGKLGEDLKRWDEMGLTCKIHAVGAGAVRRTLDYVEGVRKGNREGGVRHEVAHCVSVSDEDFPRFKHLNVTAEMSPAMHFKTTFPPPVRGHDFPKMIKAGNLVTVGSDWAFGMSLPLLPAVAHLVPQVGVEAVMQMLTINGATSVGKQDVYGMISPGKTASFIALDRDVVTEGEVGFENARVVKTWFEGELVFDADGEVV